MATNGEETCDVDGEVMTKKKRPTVYGTVDTGWAWMVMTGNVLSYQFNAAWQGKKLFIRFRAINKSIMFVFSVLKTKIPTELLRP